MREFGNRPIAEFFNHVAIHKDKTELQFDLMHAYRVIFARSKGCPLLVDGENRV